MVKDVVNATITADTLATLAASLIASRTLADHEHRGDDRDIFDARINALETEASFYEAGTPIGALYQLCVARAKLDQLAGTYICAMDSEGSALANLVERILISQIRFVENTGGITRDAAGFGFYSDSQFDSRPFGEWRQSPI
ncbi:hypothetical protein HB780_21005 [Rhizobium lusitanum]|uniref:hypothetical protein n=1 Tax=Rhizobium lusitanum TaxID=293958 RepID=UPI001608E555|nr:hypothetical protein [Rhizobium lusitanum]QND48117.1 hypothetical protein HB780_21005 [Rhizobium lusitanum]